MSDGGQEIAILSYRSSGAERPALSAAEVEVLGFLLRGDSNAAIAKARRSSVKTVENQIAELYRKLGVSSRGELAAKWAELLL